MFHICRVRPWTDIPFVLGEEQWELGEPCRHTPPHPALFQICPEECKERELFSCSSTCRVPTMGECPSTSVNLSIGETWKGKEWRAFSQGWNWNHPMAVCGSCWFSASREYCFIIFSFQVIFWRTVHMHNKSYWNTGYFFISLSL